MTMPTMLMARSLLASLAWMSAALLRLRAKC
jgi:hypothetical protein